MENAGDATQPSELVDWAVAARVGRKVAGGEQLTMQAAWLRQFADLSTSADAAVGEFTGLGQDLGPPLAEPVDRGTWVEANLTMLRRLLLPLAGKLGRRSSWTAGGVMPLVLRTSTRTVAGAEAGALLGYVGQRVLGQYDLPLGKPEALEADARILYVVPNIVAVERRFGFRPVHFRLWIALHETAHRRQFMGVPWLAPYIQRLLDSYLASVEIDEEAVKVLARRATEVVRRLIAGQPVDFLDVLVGPDQRETIRSMQAVMSVLEGHGEFVMNRLGDDLVPDAARMARVMQERRAAPKPGDRAFQKVIGLREKLDQYRVGAHFVERLHDVGGMALVNQVFSEPAAMPTLDEVRSPDRYLARAG